MKPYQQIPIIECNEPLEAIPSKEFLLDYPSAYAKLGANYGDKSAYFLRQDVLKRLLVAKQELEKIKPEWQLKIFDAYRPVSVQQFMVDYTFHSICSERNLNPKLLDLSIREAIYREVYQIWAVPSDNPLTPPPHSTGGAVDLTFCTGDGNLVDMGGEIDELSVRSHPNYYLETKEEKGKIYHQRRELLNLVMSKAGFQRHLGEWWHFCYGDQMWAWLEKEKNPEISPWAKYGRYDENKVNDCML